jgi:hypothetical protein
VRRLREEFAWAVADLMAFALCMALAPVAVVLCAVSLVREMLG